jgi:hypothetical protein
MDADELQSELEEIPGFEPDSDLTALLLDDLRDMDEDQRSEVQTYKSKIMKARRDADIDEGKPPWWKADRAAATMAGLAGEEPAEAPAGGGDEEDEEASGEDEAEAEESSDEEAAGEEATEDTGDEGGATIDVDPDEIKDAVADYWGGDLSDEELEDQLGEAVATAAIAAREEQDQIEEEQVEKRIVEDRKQLEPTEDELLAADLIDEPVENDNSDNCFKVPVHNQKCALFYTDDGDRLILHNFSMPTTLDNQWRLWIEDQLVKNAFEYAEENGLEVFAERSRIYKDFLNRYPDFEELVKNAA